MGVFLRRSLQLPWRKWHRAAGVVAGTEEGTWARLRRLPGGWAEGPVGTRRHQLTLWILV